MPFPFQNKTPEPQAQPAAPQEEARQVDAAAPSTPTPEQADAGDASVPAEAPAPDASLLDDLDALADAAEAEDPRPSIVALGALTPARYAALEACAALELGHLALGDPVWVVEDPGENEDDADDDVLDDRPAPPARRGDAGVMQARITMRHGSVIIDGTEYRVPQGTAFVTAAGAEAPACEIVDPTIFAMDWVRTTADGLQICRVGAPLHVALRAVYETANGDLGDEPGLVEARKRDLRAHEASLRAIRDVMAESIDLNSRGAAVIHLADMVATTIGQGLRPELSREEARLRVAQNEEARLDAAEAEALGGIDFAGQMTPATLPAFVAHAVNQWIATGEAPVDAFVDTVYDPDLDEYVYRQALPRSSAFTPLASNRTTYAESDEVRIVGGAIFGQDFPVTMEDTQVISTAMGQTPKVIDDLRRWAEATGEPIVENADLSALRTFFRGYTPKVDVLRAGGADLMFVEDFTGKYIYAWPSSLTRDLDLDPAARQLPRP